MPKLASCKGFTLLEALATLLLITLSMIMLLDLGLSLIKIQRDLNNSEQNWLKNWDRFEEKASL